MNFNKIVFYFSSSVRKVSRFLSLMNSSAWCLVLRWRKEQMRRFWLKLGDIRRTSYSRLIMVKRTLRTILKIILTTVGSKARIKTRWAVQPDPYLVTVNPNLGPSHPGHPRVQELQTKVQVTTVESHPSHLEVTLLDWQMTSWENWKYHCCQNQHPTSRYPCSSISIQ